MEWQTLRYSLNRNRAQAISFMYQRLTHRYCSNISWANFVVVGGVTS